uniref:Novel immune-type receptor 9 n=1 Tax=Scleropages formosus TaxID=113540 RepID=A0A8C9W4B4_SCLFO
MMNYKFSIFSDILSWFSFFSPDIAVVQIEDTVQPIPLMVAQVGDTVTLECFFPRSATSYVLWYKQSMGQKPRLVSMFYKYANSATFFNEFQRNPRYSANVSMGINHLIISDTQVSDSGTYYCGKLHVNTMTFGDGTLLITAQHFLYFFSGESMFLLHAVYCLGATLALCVILIVILICLINKRTHCQHCRGMCLL